jgi:hypothetical protein
MYYKMKRIIYQNVGTVPKSNRQIVEKGEIDNANTQIYERLLSLVVAGLRYSYWPKPPLVVMQVCEFNANNVITKNVIILNIIHNIFSHRDIYCYRAVYFTIRPHRKQLRTISMIFTFDNKFDQTDEADYMFIFHIKHQYSF